MRCLTSLARAFAVALVLAATAVSAQEQWGGYYGGFGRRVPPRFPTERSFDGGFHFCRLMYNSDRREDGGSGWTTDYPDADINFAIRLGELTKTQITRQPNGSPDYIVVRPTDPFLFNCPYLHAEDVGTMSLSEGEVKGLRDYFDKGGFMWVDDFWGPYAWDQWAEQIGRVLPPGEFPIRDLLPDHPIYKSQFAVTELPQIPSISHWRRFGGSTSERGEFSAEVHWRGISDKHGRLMVVMTHNTDISDAWEREGEDPRFFFSFSPNGYAVGIDTVLYGMTH